MSLQFCGASSLNRPTAFAAFQLSQEARSLLDSENFTALAACPERIVSLQPPLLGRVDAELPPVPLGGSRRPLITEREVMGTGKQSGAPVSRSSMWRLSRLEDAVGSPDRPVGQSRQVERREYASIYHEVHNDVCEEPVFQDIEDWLAVKLSTALTIEIVANM
jgi:hypothetical protein